jgi:DNA-binding NtrC family response regulator
MEEGMHQEEQGKLAERFYRKTMDLARKGIFGRSLKTYVPALREAYIHWLSLLEHRDVAVLLYGERGTGKRKHVDEYFYVQNLHASLSGEPLGKLKVFRGDFVDVGFTQLFHAPKTLPQDVIYFEHVDRLSEEGQAELQEYLVLRKEMSQRGIPVPRLFFGTERALSLNVMKGAFSKSLFRQLTSFAIFMPSLRDRSQDLPHLLIELIQEITGKPQLPPVWLVDRLTGMAFYENLDELQQLLRNMLAKKSDVSNWVPADFPLSEPRQARDPSFKLGKPEDATAQLLERKKLQQVLKAYSGNPHEAAKTMGLSKSEMLRKMMVYGLR